MKNKQMERKKNKYHLPIAFGSSVNISNYFKNHCCCLVAKSSLTPSHLMDCSTPSFPVLHYLP